jgi:hypothetical protein
MEPTARAMKKPDTNVTYTTSTGSSTSSHSSLTSGEAQVFAGVDSEVPDAGGEDEPHNARDDVNLCRGGSSYLLGRRFLEGGGGDFRSGGEGVAKTLSVGWITVQSVARARGGGGSVR